LGRDHSTAINSYQRMSEFLEYDKSVQKIYNTVKELLGICN
jgi:chromosomal replication initiation ATPase DnaA